MLKACPALKKDDLMIVRHAQHASDAGDRAVDDRLEGLGAVGDLEETNPRTMQVGERVAHLFDHGEREDDARNCHPTTFCSRGAAGQVKGDPLTRTRLAIVPL